MNLEVLLSFIGTVVRVTRTLSAFAARAIILLLVSAITWSLASGASVREPPVKFDPLKSDIHLYQAISERMSAGETYYLAAIREQYERGYPIAPAQTVRPPATSYLVSTLGPEMSHWLMLGLVIAALVLALVQFEGIARNRLQWLGATSILLILAVIFGPLAIYLHESWAVIFLLLSLLASRRSLTAAVILACVAFAFRELALPFFIAMAVFEFINHRRRNSLVWIGFAIACAASYLLHVLAVHNALSELGPLVSAESQSWLALGGWPFIVGSVRSVTVLSALPLWVSSCVVPLALVGWCMRKNETAQLFAIASLGFIIPFLFIGRPNNNYWAMIYALILLPGFAFSWQGMKGLVLNAINKPGATSDLLSPKEDH